MDDLGFDGAIRGIAGGLLGMFGIDVDAVDNPFASERPASNDAPPPPMNRYLAGGPRELDINDR